MGIIINSSNSVQFQNPFSIDLDGTNDHITADGIFNDISVNTGTISTWIKKDSTSTNDVVFKFDVDTNNQVGIIYVNSSSVLRYQYKAGGTTKKVDHSVSIENDGNWHHVAITWDTSADELKAYLDGSQVGSTIGSLGTWSGSINEFTIGKNSISDNSYFTGHIDQFSVFTSVVSITTLYNSGTPGNLTGMSNLIGWYQFNEGSGTSIVDSSGTGNTATLINGAAFNTDTP